MRQNCEKKKSQRRPKFEPQKLWGSNRLTVNLEKLSFVMYIETDKYMIFNSIPSKMSCIKAFEILSRIYNIFFPFPTTCPSNPLGGGGRPSLKFVREKRENIPPKKNIQQFISLVLRWGLGRWSKMEPRVGSKFGSKREVASRASHVGLKGRRWVEGQGWGQNETPPASVMEMTRPTWISKKKHDAFHPLHANREHEARSDSPRINETSDRIRHNPPTHFALLWWKTRKSKTSNVSVGTKWNLTKLDLLWLVYLFNRAKNRAGYMSLCQ